MNPALKVAAPGWNALNAPDWALVFSSEWPSLQIAFETSVTIPAGQDVDIGINHNLNYPPLCSIWISVSGLNYGRIGEFQVNKKSVTLTSGISLNVTTTYIIRCYNIDISQEASYPLPTSASAKVAPDLTTGIKIVKQNPTRGINSPNLNDFILNSQAQSPAILDIVTQASPYAKLTSYPYTITYPLQTSYIPWVTGALGDGFGDYFYYSPNDIMYNSTANTLTIQFGTFGAYASLIVMRDPLFYPNVVRAVY